MNPPLLKLVILAERLAVCRLDTKAPIPEWAAGESFLSISRTRDELSVICEEHFVPAGVQASRGWRGFKIVGPLDLDLVGSLVSVAVPLAHSNIAFFPLALSKQTMSWFAIGSWATPSKHFASPDSTSSARDAEDQEFRSQAKALNQLPGRILHRVEAGESPSICGKAVPFCNS